MYTSSTRPRPRKKRACPGCQEETFIHADEICTKCAWKLKNYPVLEEQLATLATDTKPYYTADYFKYVTRYWAGDASYHRVKDQEEALEWAMGALVMRLAVPHRGHLAYDLKMHLFTDAKLRGFSERMIPQRFAPDVAQMLDALDQAIRAYARAIYQMGVQDGSSLLHKRATSTLTTDAFNDAVVGAERKR